MMQKANVKIDIEQKRAAVKKRSQDFMILTADVSNLDPLARAAHKARSYESLDSFRPRTPPTRATAPTTAMSTMTPT